ncbi:MAG: ABC transporter ATP-binding protein [Ignavibacteriae bacterium]|nr:ABC transporter ATP-binding protein [Ignavibacteriota bacterium]MCB9214522.1 ABC transporter ATP-binding protein [Ignavibacteria bacterium]
MALQSDSAGLLPVVRLRNVTKEYRLEGKSLPVLRGVSLDVQSGEVIAVVGRSGAGKSTLLHVIGGLDTATAGEVEVVGERLDRMRVPQLAPFRNQHVGFVFQFHHLLPEFTAAENTAMPLLIRGVGLKDALKVARQYLDMVGLADRAEHKPGELSGGEQQRIAVARALIPKPTLVLADEPSGNLDSETGERLHDLLWNLSRAEGRTFVIVTHNRNLAERADRILTIEDGILVE